MVEMSPRTPDAPPTLQLSPGWPRQDQEKAHWSEKRREARSHGREGQRSRNLENAAAATLEERSLSPALAEAGSAGPSTVPSRTTSRRTAATGISALASAWRRSRTDDGEGPRSRRSGTSSLWSWSHRATQSEPDSMLPAYTVRRSQSSSRSLSRRPSTTTSVADGTSPGGGGGEANPPGYPIELARKVALLYPRARPKDRESLPPDYGQ